MILGSLIARVGKQIVQSFGRRVWRLPDKRPRGWRAERTRRRAKASGDPDPGPGPRSRGDVLAGRFALAEFTQSIFRRHRVKVTDKIPTADNFPDLAPFAGNVTIPSRTTDQSTAENGKEPVR